MAFSDHLSSIVRNMRTVQKFKYCAVVTVHRHSRLLAFEDTLFINLRESKYLEEDPQDFHKLVESDPDVLKTREDVIKNDV